MSREGIIIFQENYPNIYAVFAPLIDEITSGGEKEEFFYNLTLAYGLIGDNTAEISKYLTHLYDMNLGQRHFFFKFLVTYLPNICLLPPCMNELEEALRNTNIDFEDKNGTLNKLRESDQFWGKYCELEAAASFAKAGCKVRVLHKKKSVNKYPDLEVKFHSHKINVEVSNRLYLINKDSEINALRNKVEDEAGQLPEDGVNIVLFFVSDALIFSKDTDFKDRVNVFSFSDALFNEPAGITLVFSKEKRCKEARKRTSILDTNPNLKHIDGLFIWYHGCAFPELLGKQTRMLIRGATRENFPEEVMGIFKEIQLADIKK